METETEAATALPDDLLAAVLGRLLARRLATAHDICKAWHSLINEHHLLLQFLLPHSVRGLFINYQDYERPHFLSRPTPASSLDADDGSCRWIDGKFDFIKREDPDSYYYEVADHCNGLVLLADRESHGMVLHVCNPTRRWLARLPPPCPDGATRYYHSWDWGRRAFLVFNPFVSPEYKVLLSPLATVKDVEDDDARRHMEWPPS